MPTRWGSTYAMIKRLVKHKQPVMSTLTKQKCKITVPDVDEWEKLAKLSDLLEPYEKCTVLMGGQKYVSCSTVIPMLGHLLKCSVANDSDPVFIARFKENICSSLNSLREAAVANVNLCLATALDPRFKDLRSVPRESREPVWQDMNKELVSAADPTGMSSRHPRKKKRLFFYSDDDDASDEDNDGACGTSVPPVQQELMRYKAVPAIDDDECPLLWWRKHAALYPTISKLVRKFLCVPATTVPCERLFSLAGEVVSRKRTSLTPSNVDKLVCLADWMS